MSRHNRDRRRIRRDRGQTAHGPHANPPASKLLKGWPPAAPPIPDPAAPPLAPAVVAELGTRLAASRYETATLAGLTPADVAGVLAFARREAAASGPIDQDADLAQLLFALAADGRLDLGRDVVPLLRPPKYDPTLNADPPACPRCGRPGRQERLRDGSAQWSCTDDDCFDEDVPDDDEDDVDDVDDPEGDGGDEWDV